MPSPHLGNGLYGRNILLCEDNTLNQEIAVALLKSKGMKVSVAADGSAAVKHFQASKAGEYDAVLMDLRMPVMGGLEATRMIRALERADAKTIPIIAMTADAFEEDIHKCFESGMNDHLAKPIIPEKLFELLEKAISSQDTATE